MAVPEPGAVFKLIGGALCLDFVNTVSGRLANPRATAGDYADVVERERLVDFAALTRWAQAAGLLPAGEGAALLQLAHHAPAGAARVVARARVLREAMYRVFLASEQGWTPRPADLQVVNRELARARTRERLVPRPRGLAWAWSGGDAALDRMLWPVLRSAAELLTSDELARVRQCGGEDCRWLFLDSSRNRTRRWCNMAECGNRAKVRRFRKRR